MSMFAINKVTLFGNLTRDPELRSTPSGYSVCDLRLAVNESVKDQQTGEWRDRANFFTVTVWGKMGEFVGRECVKGTPIIIEGKLRWEEWDDANTGQKRSTVKIVADKAIPVGRREKRDGPAVPHEQATPGRRPDDEGGPWSPSGTSGIDDDIPF
jgi:single-strand DNA-binding protein